jgi:hypothetical protein
VASAFFYGASTIFIRTSDPTSAGVAWRTRKPSGCAQSSEQPSGREIVESQRHSRIKKTVNEHQMPKTGSGIAEMLRRLGHYGL